ncbi:hypothetical protein [Aequorivita flava]|uniref:DNA-binding NarL/FixJ family response regulator n=1 Tax=Aequorivita flava TaxID=3114371 RepID=A0AB35YWI3_9FLAO
MTTKTLKYLFIEHILFLKDGFHNGLRHLKENNPILNLIGYEISDIETNRPTLSELITSNDFYFVWVNLEFPMHGNERYSTATALLSALKKKNPKTRIVVITQNNTVYSLRKVLKKINPQGILEVTDCDQESIMRALNAVIKNEVYYSRNIMLLIRKFIGTFETMDDADYAILYELHLGTAVTSLPKKVHLSHSTILKKRSRLKELFNLSGKTDTDLIKEVKTQQFI